MSCLRSPAVCCGWLLALIQIAGCAPSRFERAVAYYADKHHVRDAATRRTGAAWNLRFDALLLSDLDEALAQSDETQMRAQAAATLRAASALGQDAAWGEIDRMPPAALAELANRAGTDAEPAALKAHYESLASAALERDLLEIETAGVSQVRHRLRRIRAGLEPLPDDRGRAARQLAFAWAAIPVWIGVGAQESRTAASCAIRVAREFDRVAVWRPRLDQERGLLARFAPTLVVEWPVQREYPEDHDRIGAVRLTGTPTKIDVEIDPSRPTMYAYTAQAKIHRTRHPQLVYVWWFPERPAMTPGDPVAGRIDGGTLRITLDSNERPMVWEAVLPCGCDHEVFVSRELEDAARESFGEPLKGKRFAVEKPIPGKHDVLVAGAVELPAGRLHPVIYVAAGLHDICRTEFTARPPRQGLIIVEEHEYKLRDYEALERLALGDGVASMFGADGLVHNAGRKEGYLLAPTGMLSAGQPRQRGTQRIRWDDFLLDDPHLLEKTLRLPRGL